MGSAIQDGADEGQEDETDQLYRSDAEDDAENYEDTTNISKRRRIKKAATKQKRWGSRRLV